MKTGYLLKSTLSGLLRTRQSRPRALSMMPLTRSASQDEVGYEKFNITCGRNINNGDFSFSYKVFHGLTANSSTTHVTIEAIEQPAKSSQILPSITGRDARAPVPP
ncbi:hypothetical protein ANCDUO_19868 [Ancylostoma duodenale]|uniref:Uncharacterized protein n=1 Tax=Ancylostoma duodenale TaxID=51022 RepID=A0A0C2FYY5_9BILA|nr:hypothetical protein ANCDUO_19868 [Ancylostoma duodenale]